MSLPRREALNGGRDAERRMTGGAIAGTQADIDLKRTPRTS
jgi:hypothetical protein